MSDNGAKPLMDTVERIMEKARQREATQPLQLPLWPEPKRGTPNSFIRSALFAAIQSKDRVFLKEATLASQKGIAVKFTGDGGRIALRTHVHEAAMILTIADTGIGIPTQALEKIGQPFEQVQSQYAKSQGGSGLGLAISRSLVKLHGGTMKIRSCEGRGTVVTIIIPHMAGHCGTVH